MLTYDTPALRQTGSRNVTGVTGGAGTAYPSGTPRFLVEFVLLDL
jgi:hypothetical protein